MDLIGVNRETDFNALLVNVQKEEKLVEKLSVKKFGAYIQKSDLWQKMNVSEKSSYFKSYLSGIVVKISHAEMAKEQKEKMHALILQHFASIKVYKFSEIIPSRKFDKLCLKAAGELKEAYLNALQICKYLDNIGFTSNNGEFNVRQKNGVKNNQILHLINKEAWKLSSKSTGHKGYDHIVTNMNIGISGHEKNVGKGAVVCLATRFQKIVNILADFVLLLPQPRYVKGMDQLAQKVDEARNLTESNYGALLTYYQRMIAFATMRLMGLRSQGDVISC